jgi:hypothetical protein
MSQEEGTEPNKRTYWRELAAAGALILVVSVVLTVVAVAEGAARRDVYLALGTGLLAGALVTLGIGVIDRRREAAEGKREEHRRQWERMLATRLIVTVSSYLRGADLAGEKLLGMDLRGKDLTGANLRGADMRTADLSDAVLAGADLTLANLSGAWLYRANFHSARLHGANLQAAWARGCDFTGAYLTESTDFSHADLRSTREPKSGGIQNTSFKDATLVNGIDDFSVKFDAHMKAVGARFDLIEWPQGIECPEGAIEDLSWLLSAVTDLKRNESP